MAVVIDSELVNFKSKVSSSLSSMNTALTTLTSKISELVSINTSTQSSISSVYVSENQAEILSKFDKINNIYNKINTSLESDLNFILTKSSSLIDKITNLETLQQEIDGLEKTISTAEASKWSYNRDGSNKSEVDAHNAEQNSIIAEARTSLNQKTSEFNQLHQEALSELNNLKAFDATLSFVSDFTPVDISAMSEYLTGGSFEKYSFTGSNGVKIDYYLYVPEYSTDVSSLPVHLYLHGAGEYKGKVLQTSLPKLLNNGMNVNGIVICPQGTSGWRNNDYEDALIELTNNVVSTYNADSSRISLSGHSAGAVGGYKLITRNPGYFSAFIPISGHNKYMVDTEEGWNALSDVEIWAFHGTNDETIKYSGSTNVKKALNNLGSYNIEVYSFEGGGHGIQNQVFTEKYDRDGESISPLDWAFSQTNDD